MHLKISHNAIDLRLIITICCVAHGSPAVKLIGILLLFTAPRVWRICLSGVGFFYGCMLLVSAFSIFHFFGHWQQNYLLVLCIGMGFWLISLLMHGMLYESVKYYPAARTERTLRTLFYVMFAYSAGQYVYVLLTHPNYFALYIFPLGPVGDFFRSFYTYSSDAMIIYGLFMFWFLHKRWWKHTGIAFLGLLWTNFMSGILCLFMVIGVYIVFWKSMNIFTRTITIVLCVATVTAMVILNYENFSYAFELVAKGYALRKFYAHELTITYVFSGLQELLFGAGMGNFSSRLAFMTNGEYVDWYPQSLAYLHQAYAENHFLLWNKKILSQPFMDGTGNQPFSIYNQMLGEYGLIGVGIFAWCYLGFFLRRWKLLFATHKAMFFFMLGMFFLEYWFEYFSVMIIFEWLMLFGLKQAHTEQEQPSQPHFCIPSKIHIKKLWVGKYTVPFLYAKDKRAENT